MAALPSLADAEESLGRRSSRTDLAKSPAESHAGQARDDPCIWPAPEGECIREKKFNSLRPCKPHVFLSGWQSHEYVLRIKLIPCKVLNHQ